MIIPKCKIEFIKQKHDSYLYKIWFDRLSTNNIHTPSGHKNGIHDIPKTDSMDSALEKQIKDTLNGFDVQQEIGVSYTSGPGSLARSPSVIVPYKKSVFFSNIPLVLF